MRAVCTIAAALAWVHSLSADEATVITRDGRKEVVEGVVDDYTGAFLFIRTASGQLHRIDADRVVEVSVEWSPQKLAGDRAFQSNQWRQAANLYAEANRTEARTWARRVILERWMSCCQAIGLVGQAGDIFVALVQSDPLTPALRRAPLQWTGASTVTQDKALQWLAQTSHPAVVLLGASHLLSTPQRTDAFSALKKLVLLTDEHPAAAALAEAQLWRWSQAAADDAEVDHWNQRLQQMPEELRAGPHLVIAQALLNPASGFRREVMSSLVSQDGQTLWSSEVEQRSYSERRFHELLEGSASHRLKELLDAIDAYERCCRLLQDAFDDCLFRMSQYQQRIQPQELGSLVGVKRAAKQIPEIFADVSAKLSCHRALEKGPPMGASGPF